MYKLYIWTLDLQMSIPGKSICIICQFTQAPGAFWRAPPFALARCPLWLGNLCPSSTGWDNFLPFRGGISTGETTLDFRRPLKLPPGTIEPLGSGRFDGAHERSILVQITNQYSQMKGCPNAPSHEKFMIACSSSSKARNGALESSLEFLGEWHHDVAEIVTQFPLPLKVAVVDA